MKIGARDRETLGSGGWVAVMEASDVACPRCGANNPAGARYCGRCGIPQARGEDAFLAFGHGDKIDHVQLLKERQYETPAATGIAAPLDELRPAESAKLALVGFAKGVVSIVLLWISAFSCGWVALHGYRIGTPVGQAAAVIACALWLVIPLGSAIWMWRQAGRGYAVVGFFALAIALLIYVYRQNCGAYSKRLKKPLERFPAFPIATVALACSLVLFSSTEIDWRRSHAESPGTQVLGGASNGLGTNTNPQAGPVASPGVATSTASATRRASAKPTKTAKPARTKTPKHKAKRTPTPVTDG